MGDEETLREMAIVGNLSNEQAITAYKTAVLARTLDTKIINAQRQGIIGFHVPAQGQEMIQIATAMLADKEDLIFTYYRDLALYLQRGVPLSLIFDQMLGNSNDFQKGRQMPDHFSFKEFNFSTVQSPVGAHLPLTVGAAYSMRYTKKYSGQICHRYGERHYIECDPHAEYLSGVHESCAHSRCYPPLRRRRCIHYRSSVR